MDGPPSTWTEALLRALAPHEHDFQEFKGSAWLANEDGTVNSEFAHNLSKQVGAFANGAGGRLFLGLDDRGVIDGGVPRNLRSGCRAWLEDLVPNAVEPPLRSCNVFEVVGERPGSPIRPGRAVYVLDVPASEQAPHQSRDNRYYLRIAGKSRPMGHVHVQDVLRRTSHPRVLLSRLAPYGTAELDTSDPRGPRAFVQLRAHVGNQGRVLAKHVGLEVLVPRPFAGTDARRRTRELGETIDSQKPGQVAYFRYHPVPVFPTQEVYATTLWVSFHRNNLALARAGAAVGWVLYADDAEPVRGNRELRSFQVVQRALAWLAEQGLGEGGNG
jgi:hypothetical protein